MKPVISISAAAARSAEPQRQRTLRAIAAGQPSMAAPPAQLERRRAYVRATWPALEDDIVREGIIGSADETLFSSYLGRGARCAEAVGRICLRDEPAQTRALGTGFLVAGSALITNSHVLETPEDAADCVVEFGYEYDALGAERRVQLHEFDPDRLFVTDADLDYTIVAVKPSRTGEAGKKRGFLPLIGRTGKVRNGEPLNLIHHPSGDRKKITIRESRLLAMKDLQLEYSGDTLGGSSGSPVLNDQWEVVGLHFGGKPKRDAQRRSLTLTGEVWQPGMSEHVRAYEFNVASRISQILAHVQSQLATGTGDDALLTAVLSGGSK